MLTGIALLGVITAALASWFVEKVAEVTDLTAEVRALRRDIAELRRERSTGVG